MCCGARGIPNLASSCCDVPLGGQDPAPEDQTRGHEPYASTCALRNYGLPCQRSEGTEIFGRGLARLSICNNLVRDPLSLVESVQPRAFDRANVHEYVLAAVIRLDESEAFLAIEPLHGSLRHISFFSTYATRPRASAASSLEIWREVVSPTQPRREAKSFGRSSNGAMCSIGALDARPASESQGSFPGLLGALFGHCEPSYVAIVAANAVGREEPH
jgi:hypothetical protein